MLDDVDFEDTAYAKHMRKASNRLLLCIERARRGEHTCAPEGLAVLTAAFPIKHWNAYEVERLRAMRASGLTVGQMAEELGRSRESVKDCIRRHLRGFDRYGKQSGGAQ